MSGPSVTIPAAFAGCGGGGGGGGGDNALNASGVNSFHISSVADRLGHHVGIQQKSSVSEFFELCFSLARGIDFAIANQEIPTKASELPSLLKQVCRQKCDPTLQVAMMVLMASAKSASQSGWFSEQDSQDLCHLANEMSGNFCSTTDFKSEPSGSQLIISTIMTRFYPTMKIGQILAFLEVKPGYGVFVNAFHILKNVETSSEEKIRLLVAQIDNMEASSCLVSPPQVNFLINGIGVEKRTNVFMESGPQVPTVVSDILKYGTNLLQAVGEFNGNYIILVAYMSMISTPDPATLQTFVSPAPALEDPELDIIEGPSRISLNCPISFKLIRTPVKGHSCKHLQCFDYDNYVDINSKRPSWRCPHCNQHVCFTDIRIDQAIVKVLKEVPENATDVIISSDGSWKAIIEGDDHHNHNNDENMPDKSPEFAHGETVDILDLTELDNEMDTVDQKTSQTKYQGQPYTNNPGNVNHTSHVVDDSWSRSFLSTYGLGTSSRTSNPHFMPVPVLTDACSPASTIQGGASSSPIQWPRFGNSPIPYESGTLNSIVSHRSRTPNSVPAFASQQRSRDSFNLMDPLPFNHGTLQQFSMPNIHMPQALSSTEGSLNLRAPYITSPSQGLSSASSFSRSQPARGQHSQAARPVQVSMNMPRGDQSGHMLGTVPVDLTDWRPAGRMRGSLSGQAYDDALKQYLDHAHAQSSRPAVPPNVSPQLQAFITNRGGNSSALVNHHSTG